MTKVNEKIAIMDELPINWTYPEIHPKLLEEAKKRGFRGSNATGCEIT